MKHILITITAVLLAGCGGSKAETEIISNPWTWIGILANLDKVLMVISVVIFVVFGIIVAGYFLVQFLCRKHRAKKTGEELKAEGK